MSTISCSLKPVAAKVGAASTKSNSKRSVIMRKPFNVTGTAVKSNVNGLIALGKLDCSAIEYRHFFIRSLFGAKLIRQRESTTSTN